MYPIRAKYPVRTQPLQQPNSGFAMSELSMLIMQLQSLKQDLLNSVNFKIKEIDKKIEEHTKNLTDTNQLLKDTHTQVLNHISKIHTGPAGKNADEEKITKHLESKLPKPVDEDKLAERVLAKVPRVDEEKLARKIIKSLPEHKADLKIIQEQFVTDPMSVIDKILELAKSGKFKLKTENIDGLEQTISAFRHQITTKGYIHGGGDTVAAGTNVTITNTNGTKIINATGGLGILTVTGIVNGSNQTFTVPSKPNVVVVDGVALQATDNNSNVQWTYVGTTLMLSTPPPINSIFAY